MTVEDLNCCVKLKEKIVQMFMKIDKNILTRRTNWICEELIQTTLMHSPMTMIIKEHFVEQLLSMTGKKVLF